MGDNAPLGHGVWARLLILVLARGCASPAPVAPVVPVAQPLCPAESAPAADPARDALVGELDDVDRELDAIDAALIAREQVAGQSLTDAIGTAIERLALKDRAMSDPPDHGEPFLLAKARQRYIEAQVAELALEGELGSRNPTLIRARERMHRLEQAWDQQRDLEVAYAREVATLLGQLPPTMSPAEVVAWRRRALALVIPEIRDTHRVPSDAPASVLEKAIALDELRAQRDDRAEELGPKAPEMVALEAAIADAETTLFDAITGSASPATEPAAEATMVSRRATLAARARALRASLSALRR